MIGKKESRKISEEIKSILSEGLKIEGNITAEGKIRIDGTVKGNIKGDFVIIGQSSNIEGNLEVNNLVLMGKVKGNVKGEVLEIKSTASIEGDILAKELEVEKGASIRGKVQTGSFFSDKVEISSGEITE